MRTVVSDGREIVAGEATLQLYFREVPLEASWQFTPADDEDYVVLSLNDRDGMRVSFTVTRSSSITALRGMLDEIEAAESPC